MKQNKLWFGWLGMCLFLLLGSSCSEEDRSVFGDDFEIPELTDENTIQFTVDVTGDWRQLEVLGGGGRMAIEWGDGRLQKVANTDVHPIVYKYGNRRTYRVRIWAEELDFCSVGGVLLPVSNLRLGFLPKMKDLVINSFAATQTIDLSTCCPNLETINIGNFADLERIGISGCAKLEKVWAYTHPKLTSLEVEGHSQLTDLQCSGCGLTSLSLKDLPMLRNVDVSNNPLLDEMKLDDEMAVGSLLINGCAFRSIRFLVQFPRLNELNCRNNQLTELDMSGHRSISYLDCSENQLSRLSIADNWLRRLDCHSNLLEKDALNELFEALQDAPHSQSSLSFLYYYDNPGAADCDENIPLGKGWVVNQK